MVVISPFIAPVLGALLLKFLSWRGIFAALAIIGAVAFLGSIALRETILIPNTGSIFKTISRLGVVLKNPGFFSLLGVFSLMAIPGLAYVSSSSFIYQAGFKLSSQVYSYFYAFNAMGMFIGPLVYIWLSKRFKYQQIINVDFIVIIISGLLTCVFGVYSPWMFAIVLLPGTIAGCGMGPPSTNLMLEQQKGDTGSASSLMSAAFTIMGSFGMIIASFNWGSLLVMVGMLNVIIGLLGGSLWLFIRHKPFIRPVNVSQTESAGGIM